MQPGTFRAVLYVFIVPHKKGGYPEIGRKGHLLRKTQSGISEQVIVLKTGHSGYWKKNWAIRYSSSESVW